MIQHGLQDPDAFAAFYRAHAAPLTAYFLRRTRNPEMAADLTAETFAAALDGAARYDPSRGPAVAWLYGIARRQLTQAERRGCVEDRARRRLGMERLELTSEAIERLERLAASEATARALAEALDALPADQRSAVQARVMDGRDYESIAAEAGTSESAVRQRVSRALARLRSAMSKERVL